MKQRSFIVFTFLFLISIVGFAQLTIEDHLGMEDISNLSVFKSNLVYEKTIKESWDGKTISSIFICDLNEEEEIALTENEFDYDPLWSPNGELISFISYRNNRQQVYVIPKSGGKPRLASDAQNYLSNYQWLDKSTIAYVDDEPRDSLQLVNENQNGGGYWVGTEYYTNALWSYNFHTGIKKKITNGNYRIIDFEIGNDGNIVAILGAKNYDTYESITNSWVKVIETESGDSLYHFEDANALNNLKFSPNGNRLAFVGSTAGFASNDGLFIADLESGSTENLTYDFDPTIEKLQWIDEENIGFSSPKNGYTGIYKANLKGEIRMILNPHWVIYDFQINGRQLVFSGSRSSKIKQLYRLDIGTDSEKASQLTQLNSELISKIKTSSFVLDFISQDGTNAQGIVTYPPQYNSTRAYPLMTIPHGGPDAVVMDDFHMMGQYFADNGYVVFEPNFRGSIGYGRDFYAGNRNAFGQTDFQDIMAGIDELIRLGIADEDKLVIGGWSYGGYMANWAITQTDRFKGSISVAGVSNLVSLYGQHEFSNRDIGIWEYKALPLDSIENYRKASPIFFVNNVQTPLLLLHGANDVRSPTLQAWEMYRAMQDANKVVEMMIYPGAGHGISNPTQFKSVLNNWLKWSNRNIHK